MISDINFLFFTFSRLLKPNEGEQNEAMLFAMSEILWNVGEKSKVIVALPSEVNLIPHSHTYFQDSVTEKVLFQRFSSYKLI